MPFVQRRHILENRCAWSKYYNWGNSWQFVSDIVIEFFRECYGKYRYINWKKNIYKKSVHHRNCADFLMSLQIAQKSYKNNQNLLVDKKIKSWYNDKAVGRGERRASEKKFWKKRKKSLTNRTISDIIEKLSERTRTSGHGSEKGVKKSFWKNFKKVLDKRKELWYNTRSCHSEREQRSASWKLNNARKVTTLEIPLFKPKGEGRDSSEELKIRSNNASVIEQDRFQ